MNAADYSIKSLVITFDLDIHSKYTCQYTVTKPPLLTSTSFSIILMSLHLLIKSLSVGLTVGWCSGTAAHFPRRKLGVQIQSEAGSSGHQAVIGRGSH